MMNRLRAYLKYSKMVGLDGEIEYRRFRDCLFVINLRRRALITIYRTKPKRLASARRR